MNNGNETDLSRKSAEVFSSERREDYWAIILATLTLVACYFFPDAIYSFFKKTLFW